MSELMGFIFSYRRLQSFSKRLGQGFALCRSDAGINKVCHHIAQNHQRKVGRGAVFFQNSCQLGKDLFNVFVTVTG